jgi:ABC-type methionine transport system permease subunit
MEFVSIAIGFLAGAMLGYSIFLYQSEEQLKQRIKEIRYYNKLREKTLKEVDEDLKDI